MLTQKQLDKIEAETKLRGQKMAEKKAKTKTVAKPKKAKSKIVGKTTGKGVIESWLVAFRNKKLKTAKQVSEFMHQNFPDRGSKIFDYPNIVVGRANRGLLTKGEIPKPKFEKYPLDKKSEKK